MPNGWRRSAPTGGRRTSALTAMRPRFHLRQPLVADRRSIGAALNAALDADGDDRVFEAGDMAGGFPGASPVDADL